MPLLARIFLCDLQLDGLICFFEAAEKRRGRLAHLEIDRPVFDLDDDVVIELAVERMEDCRRRPARDRSSDCASRDDGYRRTRDKKRFRHAASRRGQSRWRRRRAYGRKWTGRAALGVRFHHEAGKIRNLPVNLITFFAPPLGDARVHGIERVQTSDRFWAAEIDGDGEPDSPGTKRIRDTSELWKKSVFENRGEALTLLMAQPLIPIDASNRAYSPARVRSSRTLPFSKKIDGPA